MKLEDGMPTRLMMVVVILGCAGVEHAFAADAAKGTATVIQVDGRDLQQVIDSAPANSVIVCDPNNQLTLATPLNINKPLTLRGLCAKLPEKLGKTPLVVAKSKGVTITEFNLTGNVDSVPQSERAPLIVIAAGDFRVENGRLSDSSKDGIMIDGGYAGPESGDLEGGVVRDIVGRKIARDVVSISGSEGTGQKIRNVLVDNIRGHGSSHRGCVEVSDGAENITVRKVYAEDSVYAIDIQDHGQKGQVDRHVVIEDVYAVRCKHAIRTANKALGHAHVTLRDITARECEAPLRLTNIDNLTVSGVRIIDHKGDSHPLSAKNCNGLVLRDVTIENTSHAGPAVFVEDCDAALIDGVSLRGKNESLTSAVLYRITKDKAFAGLRITNVTAGGSDAGIVLERSGEKGLMSDYVVSGNVARVVDQIKGPRAIVTNNLP
jgi:hypothetical protein